MLAVNFLYTTHIGSTNCIGLFAFLQKNFIKWWFLRLTTLWFQLEDMFLINKHASKHCTSHGPIKIHTCKGICNSCKVVFIKGAPKSASKLSSCLAHMSQRLLECQGVVQKAFWWNVLYLFDAQAVLFTCRILSAPFMKPVGHRRCYNHLWCLVIGTTE